jgi:pimeloyl-ACP methyl ester carboxylesterase
LSDPLESFLAASTLQRLELVRAGGVAEELRGYLGYEAYGEYEELARRLDVGHLSLTAPKNLIFVPGVMGSQLKSNTKGGVWWIDVRTRNHLNDLALSPDGSEDAERDNQIVPFTTDPQYEPFLTAVLEQERFNHEVFPYDWRKLLTHDAAALCDVVNHVHEENGGNPVHLVGHSMGGLMIRAALLEHADELWPKLGKILFIATPHYGSPAIAGYLKNHLWGFDLLALLGLYLSRQTFRSLWGVVAMLPAPHGVYPDTRDKEALTEGYEHPCANFDLYRVESWRLDLCDSEKQHLQQVLDGAADFHRKLYDAHTALTQEERDRMAVIAGVGYKTLFRLEYKDHFGLWERMAKITDRKPGDRHREGDGRVPLASAELDNVPVRYVRGVHGGLPNVPAVSAAVFKYLSGQDMGLAATPEEALAGHLGVDDLSAASSAPALDGTAVASSTPGAEGDLDPGVWEPDVDEAVLEELRRMLEREELPRFTRARLL